MTSSAPRLHIVEAASLLRMAEEAETCDWCRRHITQTRILVEDLARVAQMGEDLNRHPALGKLAVTLGQFAETFGVLALIARTVHRLRGWA